MGSLLHALAKVFIFLMEIVLDLLCLTLFIFSLVGFWRWPFLGELRGGSDSTRVKFRILGAANCGCVLLDIIVLPFLLITLCSWRCVRVIRGMTRKDEDFYCLERRGYIMVEFGLLLFDIPFIVMLVFTHATVWRVPFLWRELAKEIGSSGITLCGGSYSTDSKYREIIALNALNGLIDIFLVPFALIVGITVYRVQRTIDAWKAESKLVKKKLVILAQCLQVFADLPFALFTVLDVILIIRAKPMIEDVREATGKYEWRWIVAYHLVLSFRDWLCVPFVLPLIASVYRFYFCAKGIKNAITAWNTSPPMLTVHSVHLELPEATRGRGIIVRVKASKRDAGFVLTSKSSVKLYIRNQDFWKGIGRVMGGAVAALGQTILPLSIAPKYFDVAQLEALPFEKVRPTAPTEGDGAAAVTTADVDNNLINAGEFVIDFNTATCKTIRKNANKLFAEYADIQLEYEGASGVSNAADVNGTLLTVKVNFDHFDNYVDNHVGLDTVDIPSKYRKDITDGKRFCDVFWKFVFVELAFLLFDVVCLTFLILLHLVPHRIYRVYSTACQGTERKHARSKLEAGQAFREFLCKKKSLFFRIVSKLDNGSRLQLDCITPSNDRDDKDADAQFPMRREYYYNYKAQSKRRSATEESSAVTSLLAELGQRKDKLVNTGCTELVDALEALTSLTTNHSLSLRQRYNNHFSNEHPFVDMFKCLGMFPQEAALQEREAREAEERAEKLRVERKKRLEARTARPTNDSDGDLQQAILESLKDQPNNESISIQSQDASAPMHHADSQVVDEVGGGALHIETSLVAPSFSEPFHDDTHHPGPSTASVPAVTAAVDVTPARPSELIASWQAAMNKTLAATDEALRVYEQEFSKTPWTGGKEGWGGVRKVVVEEVGNFMYDCLAVICLILIVATVYRIVPFFRSLPEVNNLRRACLLQVAEIGIDIFYLYKVMIIVSFVKGAFSLPADLAFYLLQKPSFDVARQIIDYHLGSVLEDILYILSLVVAWDTVRFALATAVFGVFSPCVVLEGAFSRWDGTTTENRPDWNFCVALVLLLMSSAWVIGVPVFVGYYVGQHNMAEAPGAVFFAIMGFVLYLGLVVSVAQRDDAVVAIRRNTIRCLTLSLRYAGVALAQLLDAAQLMALVFQASRPDLYGATIGGGLEQASNYVFATFGATWTSLGVPFGTYLAVVLAIFYFIISGAPVVCGDMLHWRKGSRIVQSPAWVSAMTFLGQTCMLTVVRNVALLFVCDESTRRLSFSVVDASGICWEGSLRGFTVFCGILLTYYVPTALMKNQKFNVAMMKSVDVVSPQLYLCLTRLPIATCCVLCTLRYDHRAFCLATVLVTMVWCVAISVAYSHLFGSSTCSVSTVGWYRVITYSTVGISAAFVLGQLQQNTSGSSYWSLYATIAIIAIAMMAVVAVGVVLSRRTKAEEDTIEDVKQTLSRARRQLASIGALKTMPGVGDASGKVFHRRLAQATRCSELAVLLTLLEAQCFTVELSPLFLSTRSAWEKKTQSLMDPNDKTVALDIDWYRMDFPRYLLCCECCRGVNSHNSKSDDDEDDSSGMTEDEKLVLLQEVCQSLTQAAQCR